VLLSGINKASKRIILNFLFSLTSRRSTDLPTEWRTLVGTESWPGFYDFWFICV